MCKKFTMVILLFMLSIFITGCNFISTNEKIETDDNGYILFELNSSNLKDVNISNTEYVEIPSTFEKDGKMYKIVSINDYTFKNFDLAKIIILPDTITSIGSYAFYGCTELTTVIIPEGVTEIGGYAFHMCINLTELTIPSTISNLGRNITAGCTSLTNIIINENNTNYTSKDGVVFSKDESTLICFPGGKTEYTIPENTKIIADYAFSKSQLMSITIPDNIEKIKEGAFLGCRSLTEVLLPNNLTEISNYTFYGCNSLKNISIPKSITKIGRESFFSCSSLENLILPDTIEEIEPLAFKDVQNIIYNGNIEGAPWGAKSLNKES